MSWMNQAWRVFRMIDRPIGSRDIACRTGMSDNQAQKCICALRASGCIEFVAGAARTGRLYRAIKGAVPPQQDRRGKTPSALDALARARQARHLASRPVSQFTAARQAVPVGQPARGRR